MPCTTPGCPAELASAPRRYHADGCRYAAGRSGKSGASGGNRPIRIREDIGEDLRAIRDAGLEDEAVEALRAVRSKHGI